MTADNYTLLNTFPNDNFPQNEFITTKNSGIINKCDQGLLSFIYCYYDYS